MRLSFLNAAVVPLKGHEAAGLVVVQLGHHADPEMEFLDISLRKDSSLLLHMLFTVFPLTDF
jgi:hypothetical protein